jgi:hypothetical protein
VTVTGVPNNNRGLTNMRSLVAPALALACLGSSSIASAQCEFTTKRGFQPAIFIAQQGEPTTTRFEMYGVVRTDCFLIGGHFFYAGTAENSHEEYTLDDFLSATRAMLTERMDGLVMEKFPDLAVQRYDAVHDEWYLCVPEDRFQGLAIMDIEGDSLDAHPDSLLDHYLYTTWNGLSGNDIADRIMQQYGLCADMASRALPGGRIGLFNPVRGRLNGSSSEDYVRRVNFFKQKCADPRNWLGNLDYICPILWSGWAPIDEQSSCQNNGATIHSCAARYYGAIDVAIGAWTRGPLVDFDSCDGDRDDPFSGCANVTPEEWAGPDPLRDGRGNLFKICPLLTVRVANNNSCANGLYLIQPNADPTLANTHHVTTDYLNNLVFNQPACIVDCYAYYTPNDEPILPIRQALTVLSWPLLGDYNGNGRVGPGDDNSFNFHYSRNDLRADLNGDGNVNRQDREMMDAILGE